METEPFNPLDKRNLGISIANAIFDQQVLPLGVIPSFGGAGIYAIYYHGDFPLYHKIAEANQNRDAQPIYAGKAVPEGSRRGGAGWVLRYLLAIIFANGLTNTKNPLKLPAILTSPISPVGF